eukprot:713070-Pyramimonas_sp.AAC.1
MRPGAPMCSRGAGPGPRAPVRRHIYHTGQPEAEIQAALPVVRIGLTHSNDKNFGNDQNRTGTILSRAGRLPTRRTNALSRKFSKRQA